MFVRRAAPATGTLRAIVVAAAIVAVCPLPGLSQTAKKPAPAKKTTTPPPRARRWPPRRLQQATAKTSAVKRKPTYSAAAARARRARLARARSLAYLAQPRFKTDANGATVPDIRAEAAIIYNPETGQVLWEEKAFDQRSIASITKVMTAICMVEDNPDLTEEFMVDRADTQGRVGHLPPGVRAGVAQQPAAPHADRLRQRGGAGCWPGSPREARPASSPG